MVAARLLLPILASAHCAHSSEFEVGYELLFSTSNEVVERACVEIDGDLPSYLAGGSFILPSLGQFELGGQEFVGILDAFGKLQRFDFEEDGKLCFSARMLESRFYNDSIAKGKVAASMLFLETIPPRHYSGIRNVMGGNDNDFVNTYEMGGVFRAVTDQPLGLEFDPATLGVLGKIEWADAFDANKMEPALGSAHPLPHPDGERFPGCVIDVHPERGMMNRVAHNVSVFYICPEAPSTRVLANWYIAPYMPYFHSFGVSESFVVLPHMHTTLDIMKAVEGEPMMNAFVPADAGKPMTIVLLPLNGDKAAIEFVIPTVFYYTHVINTYENSTAVTFDFVSLDDVPFVGDAVKLPVYRNATARDAISNRPVPKRLVMHYAGELAGTATLAPLVVEVGSATFTDFPNLNHRHVSKPYCFFYAVEWHHGGAGYASKAIVKHDVCGGSEASYFYEANCYPSEPTFVASPNATAEDDGVLVFASLDGVAGETSMVVVDARTMAKLGAAEVASRIPFSTHGQFYRGLDVVY